MWVPFRLLAVARACVASAAITFAAAAAAQTLPVDLSVTGDVRLVGADGEASWIDGGLGKTRFGGARDGDFRLRPELTEAAIVWQPRLGWAAKANIAVIAQQGQEH